MPVARYFIWVGTLLMVLLFVANWVLPNPLPEPAHEASPKPIVRIASMERAPERVVIDTNQPTIVPPPAKLESSDSGIPSPTQSYASVDPSTLVAEFTKKRAKAVKRRAARAVTYQPAVSNTAEVALGGSETTARSTRLSFAGVISGQLLRNLFNLH